MWLEILRERLLVGISSDLVRACQGSDTLWTDLRVFLRRLLASSLHMDLLEGDIMGIKIFTQVCQEAVLTQLASSQGPLLPAVLEVLGMLFLKDAPQGSFFMRHGVCTISSSQALEVAGNACCVPPSGASWLFIQNANMFYAGGGFDAILRRLNNNVCVPPPC